MATSEDLQNIVALAGPLKGKRFKVKADTLSIGTSRKCDITLKGDYVSELHAVVKKREDGTWVVQNNSVNGTLINSERADLKVLKEGDRIQIGSKSLLEVSFETGKKPKPKAVEGDEGASSRKKIMIGGGLAVYLVLMVAVVLFLTSDNDSGAELGAEMERISSVKSATHAYLINPETKAINQISSAMEVEEKADLSARYYSLRQLVESNAPTPEIEQQADEIVRQIAIHLDRAWQFEQRDQKRQAVSELETIFQLVPDIRAPSAKFAVQRISRLKENAQ